MSFAKILYSCNGTGNNCKYCIYDSDGTCLCQDGEYQVFENGDWHDKIIKKDCINGIEQWIDNNKFAEDMREVAQILFDSGYQFRECCQYCMNSVYNEFDDILDDCSIETIPDAIIEEDGTWHGRFDFSHCTDGINSWLLTNYVEE